MSRKEKDDKELDFKSPRFNPRMALYSQNLRVPNPRAPILDNMSRFIPSASGGITIRPSTVKQKPKESKTLPDQSEPSTSAELPVRRFLPHQMPVPTTRRPIRTVLTRMEECTEGPLSLLRDCMQRKLRVKVFTRNMSGIRGHCEAVVAAFDKHMNMALEDVQEFWTRKKRRKTTPHAGKETAVNLRHENMRIPRVHIVSSTDKTENCRRSVPQLLIRGEQVALVAVQNYAPP